MRRQARNRSRRGLSLLELLIAVTLVALLSLGMLFAMGVGFDALEKANGHLMGNRRVLGAQRVLERQISSLMPVAARCGPAGRLYFQGSATGIRFVSSYSLEEAALGYSRVVEYSVIPGENGEGVRLVLTERPYTGPFSLVSICGPSQPGGPGQANARPFVLADRLAACRFAYQDRRGGWSDGYNADLPPTAVRVEMAPLEPNPARLQMGSMIVPVRAAKNLRLEYVDVEPPPQP